MSNLIKNLRPFLLGTILCLSVVTQLSHGQITAGSTLRYDKKGAPDPLTGCWFQSVGDSEVSLHYEKFRVPSKVEGKLLSPTIIIDWDVLMDYKSEGIMACVRLMPAVSAILFSEKNDLSEIRGMLFDQIARRWFLFEGTNVLETTADIPLNETIKHARLVSRENQGYQNSLVSAVGVMSDWNNTYKSLESSFDRCVFRKDPSGKLVLGLISERTSKTYLPPMIANISPEVFGEFIPQNHYNLQQIIEKKVQLGPWPFNSSTRITVSKGPLNSLVAQGQLEFLLLGWNMCLPNFGKGTRIHVQKGTRGIVLIDCMGNSMKADDEADYTFNGNRWIRNIKE